MGTFWPKGGRATTFTTNGFEFGDGVQFPAITQQLYVTKTGDDTLGDGSIVKPFLTIQKAVNTAVGNTLINISPGLYVENITFPAVNGVLLNGGDKQTTFISGTLDISLGGNITLENLSVDNAAASVVIFGGIANQSLDMRNVRLTTQAGNTFPCLLASNTGGGSINCFNTQIGVNDSTGGSKAIVQTGDTNFNMFNCNASINDNNDNIALDFSGAGGGYSHQFGSIGGQSVLSGGVSFNISILGVITNTVPCIVDNTAGFVLIGTASFITTANPCVTGAGNFNYLLVGKLFGAGAFAPTLNGGAGANPLPMDGSDNVMYNNTISGLLATNVKTAIDELALKSGIAIAVNQPAHGFTLGQAVYQDAAGVWQLAIADINNPNFAAEGIVTNVTVNDFICVRGGRISVPGHGLTPLGDYFYNDQVTAGALTGTQPLTGLQVLVGKIVDANTLDIGPVITSLAGSNTPPTPTTVLILQTRNTAANDTLLVTDYTLLVDATGGAIAITVPLATAFAGQIFNVKKIDASANTVTLTASGADTIDGLATQVETAQYQNISIQSDGTNWYIL